MADFQIVVRVLKGHDVIFESKGRSGDFSELAKRAIEEFRMKCPDESLLADDIRLRFDKA